MLSFVCLSLLLGAGHLLRLRIRLLRKLYLPSSVIGGLLGLLILQGLQAAGTAPPPDWTAGWSGLAGKLINIVFACLFLGVALPKFSVLWRRAGMQLAYGQTVAWGQYMVGLGLFLLALRFFTDLPPVFGCVLPVGFEGGHGTAGGLAPVFDEFGWPAGKDYALTAATLGIISAIITGMTLVNWAVRKGYAEKLTSPDQVAEDESVGIIPLDRRPAAGRLTVSSDVIESLSLHLVIIALAVAFGYALKGALLKAEALSPFLSEHRLLSGFPLFPLCMIGGLLIQLCEDRFDRHKVIDVGIIRRIQNCALDFLVVAAIATIRVEVVAEGLIPLLLLVAAGIGWNVCCVIFLARRVFRTAWFERAIAEMGQSMGITATGLLLLRVVDPEYETDAADAFACKQVLHEPFMGGGLWTSAAIPLCFAFGAGPVLAISCGAVVFWLIILAFAGKRRTS